VTASDCFQADCFIKKVMVMRNRTCPTDIWLRTAGALGRDSSHAGPLPGSRSRVTCELCYTSSRCTTFTRAVCMADCCQFSREQVVTWGFSRSTFLVCSAGCMRHYAIRHNLPLDIC